MARGKGTANLAASLEVLAGAPLDARDVCPTVEDLYAASNWPYKYIGMKTTVLATGDTYRLVDLDVTQESSWVKEGSGGGGHTIEGDGTAVTDRDTLNFKDMSVSDDGQNEKTDVKPHRLTAEELADIISPLPVHDFSNTSSEAFVCSTNERAIGQWIDGKPLYQKTVYIGTLGNGTPSIPYIAEVEITSWYNNTSISDCVFINGIAIHKTVKGVRPLPFSDGSNNENSIRLDISASSNRYFLRAIASTNWGSDYDAYATLRYTKTTDTAVASGEKIIGQWIDGKPLYEKIISNITLDPIPSGQTYSETAVCSLSGITVVRDEVYGSNIVGNIGESFSLPYLNMSGNIIVKSRSHADEGAYTILSNSSQFDRNSNYKFTAILRYTKV